MKTLISNKLIIKCEQKSSNENKKKCHENKKYEMFAKKVVDKRKTEITSIKDSLSDISKNEIARIKDLFNYHLDFYNKNNGSPSEVSQENIELSINDIVVDNNANDGFFEN